MKKTLGSQNCLYPMPTTIVGAKVNGKPNYITIAWLGTLNADTVFIASNSSHYTNEGIKALKTFSINIPSEDMVKKVDYIGMVSGKNVDKSKLFTAFYGKLKNAPMIEECMVNMECEVTQILNMDTHEIFVARIVETYCNEEYLTNWNVDLAKLRPLLFSMYDTGYWQLGNRVATAWNVGREFKIEE